jgi:hypothetical protein
VPPPLISKSMHAMSSLSIPGKPMGARADLRLARRELQVQRLRAEVERAEGADRRRKDLIASRRETNRKIRLLGRAEETGKVSL